MRLYLDSSAIVKLIRREDESTGLDAIHVASAYSLGRELRALVTYDNRMAEAAETVGLHVDTPS